jgi:Mn-containing catalase
MDLPATAPRVTAICVDSGRRPGLHPVESQIVGGKGLSVGDINGKIDGEDRGKQDDAQKGTTSTGTEAIGKAKSIKGGDAKSTSSKKHT